MAVLMAPLRCKLERFTKNLIESKVEAARVSCRLEIDSVEIFFFNPSHLVLHGIHFEAGDFGALQIETRAASADVLISV